MNPYKVTQDFEKELCRYTGAPYAVAVNSCTMALFLCCQYLKNDFCRAIIPKRTYISVPQVILQAGLELQFHDMAWHGSYELFPLNVIDSARRFTCGMYNPSEYRCVSFHGGKILGIETGGAILHDNPEADEWFRMARHDGRREGRPIEEAGMIGWHCYMNPSTAAQGLLKMHFLKNDNPDLANDDYPDLSQMEMFKCKTI